MGKIIQLVKLLKELKVIYDWIVSFLLLKKQKKQVDNIKAGESKIESANSISDEKERLKKKAEGAREIENNISN